MKAEIEGEIMKPKKLRASLDRCSRTPYQLMVGVQTEKYYRKLRHLPESRLRLARAVEILLHAYEYVQGIDPNGESGAAAMLWSKYNELKRERQRNKRAGA